LADSGNYYPGQWSCWVWAVFWALRASWTWRPAVHATASA